LLVVVNLESDQKKGPPISAKYDLVANISHEGLPGANNGTYKVHVVNKGNEQWYQIQDLIVEEIMPQMIFLSESYVQVRCHHSVID
jgi:U4/U6.U5 tri-snRNP-associated protein 2